jgi:hypothetical protein
MNEWHFPAPALGSGMRLLERETELPGGRWYEASEINAALEWTAIPQPLAGSDWLTFDLITDRANLFVLMFRLFAADGRAFDLLFAALPHAQARFRLPLSATAQDRWLLGREGAWLKPICWGAAMRPDEIVRASLLLHRLEGEPARWCMTLPRILAEEPERLREPKLLASPLLDRMGQSTTREWPGKSLGESEVAERLRQQLAGASQAQWPESWNAWGGSRDRRYEATGWFRAQNADGRWWLVDPDGGAFWSSGPDCCHPLVQASCGGLESALAEFSELAATDGVVTQSRRGREANHLAANFIRTFGAEWRQAWERIAVAELKRAGFNTVGNWSDWRWASRAGIPYVRPMELRWQRVKTVFRDMPDVFDPAFEEDAADFAAQLEETRDDRAMIGYFLMNEPQWGFADQILAEGMLAVSGASWTRAALVAWLKERYGDEASLARAWELPNLSFDQLSVETVTGKLSAQALADLAEFSALMVRRLFQTLNTACRRVDANHLNLGARYYRIPPDWVVAGMVGFDVFSMNCYAERPPIEDIAAVAERLDLPVMIGEFHFGALDAGLPASGIGHVADQADRGRAFAYYVESAAAHPACIGAHYFTLYDQSWLGRFDGENYNIGLLDVCHRRYEPFYAAARMTHERLYAVAAGEVAPTEERASHRAKIFI